MDYATLLQSLNVCRHMDHPLRSPQFPFSHRSHEFATHQPVLCEALARSSGPVLELGSGEGSTQLMHRVCSENRRYVLTLDNNPEWLNRYVDRLTNEFHDFGLVEDWPSALRSDAVASTEWGLVFVDSAPWESRALAVRLFAPKATFVVVHDCDYFPRWGMFGTEIEPLQGATARGRREYGDVFRSWREHFPLEPWPYAMTGPPTLIGSNRVSADFDVDYTRY